MQTVYYKQSGTNSAMDELEDWERELLEESDGWEEKWTDVCVFPNLYTLPGNAPEEDKEVEAELRRVFSGRYSREDTPKFKIEKRRLWHVYRVCPCGLRECDKHVIPSECHFHGSMEHKGVDLVKMFQKRRVMSVKAAEAWWKMWGETPVEIRGNTITRRVYKKWDIQFPKGHAIEGKVLEGEEKQQLEAHFDGKHPNGVPKYIISDTKVEQQCPCGKKCSLHVLPSSVQIDAPFPLVLHENRNAREFESEFRALDALTIEEAEEWFKKIPLKWEVRVTPEAIRLRMLCRCGKATEQVPCAPCQLKMTKECTVCHKRYRKRSIKQGRCGNCRRNEMIHCEHCNERVRRAHRCVPLLNTHYTDKPTGIYPPCLRSSTSSNVICPDCNECMKYNIYHRHQYRAHCDVEPGDGYTRAYKWHKCPYCSYRNCDITNMREHTKIHVDARMHPCKHPNCGATFTRASAEVLHRRLAHGTTATLRPSLRRVGSQVVMSAKRRKINYV